MKITVQFFAAYADILGKKSADFELRPGARVKDLLENIQTLPSAERLPPKPLIAVNLAYASLDRPLLPGDEIALIPPVAGG